MLSSPSSLEASFFYYANLFILFIGLKYFVSISPLCFLELITFINLPHLNFLLQFLKDLQISLKLLSFFETKALHHFHPFMVLTRIKVLSQFDCDYNFLPLVSLNFLINFVLKLTSLTKSHFEVNFKFELTYCENFDYHFNLFFLIFHIYLTRLVKLLLLL